MKNPPGVKDFRQDNLILLLTCLILELMLIIFKIYSIQGREVKNLEVFTYKGSVPLMYYYIES